MAGQAPSERAAVAGFFDAEASAYDCAHDGRGPAGHVLRSRMATVLRFLPNGGGDALDAGMGPGRLCEELERRGFRVAGVDGSEEMVRLARARLPHARARLVQASIEKLPFPAASFDVVTATGVVVEYCDDPTAALAELSRVLRPGGRAVISAPNFDSLYGRWRRRAYNPAVAMVGARLGGRQPAPYARPALPTQSLLAMMTAAGLLPKTVAYAGYLVAPSPLDLVFGGTAARIAQRLEAGRPRLGRLLAAQLVIAAGKGTSHGAGEAERADR